MLSSDKKQKVTQALQAWLDPKNPRRTGTFLKGVTGVNDTFISLIKKGQHELKGYPLADAHYFKIAKEIGLELDDKFHWSTGVFSTIQQALKVAHRNQRRMLLDVPTRQGKTYALEFYARNNDKVLYIKARKAMRTKELLAKMAAKLNMNLEGIRGELALMDAVMDRLTGENGWLIILDECEKKQSSFYDAIKEIEDFTRGVAGFVIVGAGMRRDWDMAADRMRGIFPQLRGRFFVNKLEMPGIGREEVEAIVGAEGITDKNVITWFGRTVKDLDCLSQYLTDLREITQGNLQTVDIQMINEVFS